MKAYLIEGRCVGCLRGLQRPAKGPIAPIPSLYARPRETPFIRGDEGTIIVSTYAEIRVATKG
jgi:hypothetical protein